jgi:hypothetical protein
MWPTSTAVRPAFVTIAIRPSSLGRVARHIRRFRISVKWNIFADPYRPMAGVFCPTGRQILVGPIKRSPSRAAESQLFSPVRATRIAGWVRRRGRLLGDFFSCLSIGHGCPQ